MTVVSPIAAMLPSSVIARRKSPWRRKAERVTTVRHAALAMTDAALRTASEAIPPRHQSHVLVAGLHLLADPAGALVHEGDRVLIVADLHLEKGSSFARRGMLLPPYDTAVTLGRLAALIARYAPRCVVALGDSFHDPAAAERLTPADRDTLHRLIAGRDWLWITGNHDPRPPAGLPGETADGWRLGPLHLRHEPQPGHRHGEIAGHLHPVALVAGRTGTVRRRSFVSDGSRCVMPAFGAYAGGLNLHDPAFARLFAAGSRVAHALGRTRVYAVAERHCLAEFGR